MYKGTAFYKSLFLLIWLIVLFVSCCELILYVVIPCFFKCVQIYMLYRIYLVILSFNTGTKFTKICFVSFHFVYLYIPILISRQLICFLFKKLVIYSFIYNSLIFFCS